MPHKNVKPFAGYSHGLVEIKLMQLDACACIDEVVLSTNDEAILAYAESLRMDRLVIHVRDENLALDTTSTDELIGLARDITSHEHILWTHVTSPFFSAEQYALAVDVYLAMLANGYDSLMTAKELRGFLWNRTHPVNYSRDAEKWPRTQTLVPLFELDSAVFLSSRDNYAALGDRIGESPYLHVTQGWHGFDIDWPEDFLLAEAMLEAGLTSI